MADEDTITLHSVVTKREQGKKKLAAKIKPIHCEVTESFRFCTFWNLQKTTCWQTGTIKQRNHKNNSLNMLCKAFLWGRAFLSSGHSLVATMAIIVTNCYHHYIYLRNTFQKHSTACSTLEQKIKLLPMLHYYEQKEEIEKESFFAWCSKLAHSLAPKGVSCSFPFLYKGTLSVCSPIFIVFFKSCP